MANVRLSLRPWNLATTLALGAAAVFVSPQPTSAG